MGTKQFPTSLGLSFEGVNCLVVFPTHLTSLLFMFTPALTAESYKEIATCLRSGVLVEKKI